MFGARGFRSDFDVVVDGSWGHVINYLYGVGAVRNRFGGYRLCVGGSDVDVWAARDTWAIKEGLVQYQGIESLLKTTILNWDAILMDWRTKEILCGTLYFDEIRTRTMDIILEANPNPLGAAVRAFRHFCLKDAKSITVATARYLSHASKFYGSQVILVAERTSYIDCAIEQDVLNFFSQLDTNSTRRIREQFSLDSKPFQQRLI